MYPLFCKEPYPRNQWYMAAWSHEVTNQPFGRTVLDTPLVLYRKADGGVVVLDGRCPHRRYPLAKGWVENDSIVCPYHGYSFNAEGQCTHVPSQSRPVETQKTIAFPVRELWNWIWVWMGDPDLADEEALPPLRLVHANEAEWTFTQGGLRTIKARYMLLHDNLFDLSHISYLHKKTVGSPGVAKAKVTSEEVEWGLDIHREVRMDSMGDSLMGKALNVNGLIDRFMPQQYFAPCLHVTGSEFRSAENGGSDPGHLFGSYRVIHIIVPETAHSTHYFWGFTRTFKSDDAETTELLRKTITSTLEEDVEASEAIEKILLIPGGPTEISSPSDIVAAKGRRIMKRLIDHEADKNY